jgi:preprotein translocase subunit SecF
MIKTPVVEGSNEGSQAAVRAAFDAAFNGERGERIDLNQEGRDDLAETLVRANPDRVSEDDPAALAAHYDEVADRVMSLRESDGILTSWDEIRAAAGLGTETFELLQNEAYLGSFTVLAAENVGPQIGAELRTKGILAVVFSLAGMLAYIWIRFELRFSVGAVAAVFHDVVISLGAFALAGYEFNLTTVAAFLTVVGYSVNDTVIIFDRVRENLRQSRREPLAGLLNRSLNQTLSRTVLTSGTTLLTVGTLFVLGGEVIRGFAFVLLVGIAVGTYSSIFIASPVVLAWESGFGRRRERVRA